MKIPYLLPEWIVRALEQIVSVVVAAGSRNFFDSAVRVETSGLQREEHRLALEVSIKKKNQAIGVQFRLVDANQQLADGLSNHTLPMAS